MYLYLSQEWSQGLQKFAVFDIIIKHRNGRGTFTSLQRPHRVILQSSSDLKMYINSKIRPCTLSLSIKINRKDGYTLITKYAECEKRKVYSGVFHTTFFVFCAPFFCFLHFTAFCASVDICAKTQRFCGLFFRSINKTRNLHEM